MNQLPRAKLAFPLAAFLALVTIQAVARDSAGSLAVSRVSYEISLAGASQHLVRVRLLFGPGAADCELQLPVWNALYQIRDFSQYVSWVRARSDSGHPLAVSKLDKGRWRFDCSEGGGEIEYEIFADLSGPFGAQLNAHHAFFNLAQILMYPVRARIYPMQVRFTDIPPGWRIATTLANSSEEFVADNYDQLVDSPVEIGSFQESDFDEGGGHYRVVVDADPSDYDLQSLVFMVRRLVSAATAWMDDRPCQTYLFMYHFSRAPEDHGMEHACSTAIEFGAGRQAENPQGLRDVSAHEFFHLWDVKRIRPQSLEPVDYTKENYTRALWFSEGVDTTAGNIILLRAGLLDERRYLRGLAAEIAELQRRPAHLTQSAEQSSLDAWLEKYDYYKLPGRSISYYNKGYLLGVLLDLQLREATHGSASLRDVLLWMNRNYAQQGKFFPDSDGVQQAAEAVSHTSLGWFFQKYVAGTEEIPWDDFFKTVGLHLVRRGVSVADPEFMALRDLNAALVVASVTPMSAAQHAGLAPGDTILEINGQTADSDFEERLTGLRPGDKLHLRVRNWRGDHELQWKLAGREEVELDLADVDNVTAPQKARRAAWLKGESQNSGETRP